MSHFITSNLQLSIDSVTPLKLCSLSSSYPIYLKIFDSNFLVHLIFLIQVESPPDSDDKEGQTISARRRIDALERCHERYRNIYAFIRNEMWERRVNLGQIDTENERPGETLWTTVHDKTDLLNKQQIWPLLKAFSRIWELRSTSDTIHLIFK